MILSGKTKPLIKKLEKDMIKHSKNEQFEKAIEIREKLLKLQKLIIKN